MAGEAGMDTGCRRAWPQMLSTALTLVWIPGIPRSTLPRYGVIDPAPLPGLTPSAPLWCHYETSGFRGMERAGWLGMWATPSPTSGDLLLRRSDRGSTLWSDLRLAPHTRMYYLAAEKMWCMQHVTVCQPRCSITPG